MVLKGGRVGQQVTLHDSAAETATGSGSEEILNYSPASIDFEFDLTAASSAGGDTIDLYVQTKILTNWVTIVHFTQALGNGGVKRYFSHVASALAEAEFENGTAMGAAAVRHLLGMNYRADWVIARSGSFTFTLCMNAKN